MNEDQNTAMTAPARPTPETDAHWNKHRSSHAIVDLSRKLERERDEAREERAWRPIESAPRDGATLIWACNKYEEQGVMRWIEGEGYGLWSWNDELLSDMDPEPYQPTHWMPLPTPPEALAREGGGGE